MQLDLGVIKIVDRLDRMKDVLKDGSVIKQDKIISKMLEKGDFESSKREHAKMQALHRIKLENAMMQMSEQISDR